MDVADEKCGMQADSNVKNKLKVYTLYIWNSRKHLCKHNVLKLVNWYYMFKH